MSPNINNSQTTVVQSAGMQFSPYLKSSATSQAPEGTNSLRYFAPIHELPSPILSPTFGIIPVQIFKGLSGVVQSISDFNESAKTQRQQDLIQGKGLIQGAGNFSDDVAGFYKYLGKIDSDKFNRSEILPHLAGISQDYMQEQAGRQILSSVTESFPETMSEIDSFFGNNSSEKYVNAQSSLGSGVVNAATNSADEIFGLIGSKVLGWAGAAYSIYEISKGKLNPQSGVIGGAAAGAYVGSAVLPGIGTVVGTVIGGIGGLISGMFKSGKPEEQKERDALRKQLQAAGILDGSWNIALADGAAFDMGKDGGAKLMGKDGSLRGYKEFDYSNPLVGTISQIVAPLAKSICGCNQRLSQEFTAYFTNAVTSNTDSLEGALKNLQVVYAQFGIPLERVLQVNYKQQQVAQ